MLNDRDKQKLKECWERAAVSPAAGHVLAPGKGKDGVDITVGYLHKRRLLPGNFEAACGRVEKAIDSGYFADVDEYIAETDFLHGDAANMTKDFGTLQREWAARKLAP